jgi:hypothetical protein
MAAVGSLSISLMNQTNRSWRLFLSQPLSAFLLEPILDAHAVIGESGSYFLSHPESWSCLAASALV